MAYQAKKIAVLGSTGSIGRQTLDVIRSLPDYCRVVGLAAGNNLELLAEQIAEFRPAFFNCIMPVGGEKSTFRRFKALGGAYLSPEQMAVQPDVDIVVIAFPGAAGRDAALAAAGAGKRIALANKESLVAAGALITAAAAESKAEILPVDSEHSAIWQCLAGEKRPPRRIILTASGGPFRNLPLERMRDITPEQALAHPSWKMGKKVTVDSATLMNKGLEVIEARWLFDVPVENIDVIIHPQSIVHSLVEFIDGSVKAQLGVPDMRLPIQYALTYPDRLENPALPRLDWHGISSLVFEQLDTGKFPCLRLAVEAGKQGGTCPAVLSAADEIAVELFLGGRIAFTDIPRLVEQTMEKHVNKAHPAIDDIRLADRWARNFVMETVEGKG